MPTVSDKGTFTWRYRPGSTKSSSITVYFTAGSTDSAPVTVKLK